MRPPPHPEPGVGAWTGQAISSVIVATVAYSPSASVEARATSTSRSSRRVPLCAKVAGTSCKPSRRAARRASADPASPADRSEDRDQDTNQLAVATPPASR